MNIMRVFLDIKGQKRSWALNSWVITIAITIGSLPLSNSASQIAVANALDNCRTFSETGKTICGKFLDYWTKNGAVRQQGLPLSNEMQEKSGIDGKTYTVQYFERAVFEMHPENQPPYDVLLSLLGTMNYTTLWGRPYWPVQTVNSNNPLFFSQTGKTIGGAFRIYWEQNGGIAQQGYPITNEFKERSPIDDKLYTVQYFERAVFEMHPENQPPYDVLLSLLGRYRYDARYNAAIKPTPATITQDCSAVLKRRGTSIAQGTNTVPTSRLKLKSYSIEEVSLYNSISCPGLIPASAERYWRFTISAEEPLFNYSGSEILGIWIDDKLIGSAGVSEEGYVTRAFDLTLLHDGGTISLGLQGGPRDYLTERLQFNKTP